MRGDKYHNWLLMINLHLHTVKKNILYNYQAVLPICHNSEVEKLHME
jgi:hypothetical protein